MLCECSGSAAHATSMHTRTKLLHGYAIYVHLCISAVIKGGHVLRLSGYIEFYNIKVGIDV